MHISAFAFCARAPVQQKSPFQRQTFFSARGGGVYFTINGFFVPTHKFYSIGHKSEFMNARARERDAHSR
jgi:hypothetical protein